MNKITVLKGDIPVTVYESVAKQLGLVPYQQVTQDQVAGIIRGNAALFDLLYSTPTNTNEHDKDLHCFLQGGWCHAALPEWVQYICIDGYGRMYWFENEPQKAHYGWIRSEGKSDLGRCCDIDGHNPAHLIWQRPQLN